MRVNALIVLAGLPPLNMTARHWGDWVWAVTDIGNGPVTIRSVVDLDRERWLVPGTPAVIDVDPARLDQVRPFTVDWSSVPPIQDRVAANDPVLADPRAARAKATQALTGTARPAEPAQPAKRGMFGHGSTDFTPSSGPGLKMRPWAAACADAIAATASTPAPPGKMRVVAIVSAMRMMFTGLGHDRQGRPDPDDDEKNGLYAKSMRGNETVFSVNVAGRAPWAVWVPDFQAPRRRPVYRAPELYPWLPALMPVDGRGPLEILWDDVTELSQQVQQLAAGSASAQMAQAAAAMQAWQARMTDMAGPAGEAPPSVPPDLSTLPPEAHQSAAQLAASLRMVPEGMRQMVIDQSRMGLNSLPPEMREAYLALWRSHGIPV
jgi:hypothetical protein